MDKCPKCGKPLHADSDVCPECGMTIPQTDYTQISDRTLPGQRPAGAEEQALSVGSTLGGRYEVLEVIGKGGMGWVYKARDREIDRVVALKVIRQDLARDETVIKRFKDEIILARKVTHKNVLRIYDIAEAEGHKFISMPYIEGKDLKDIIAERGALPIDEAVRIATQVLEALRSAHEAGVIHRDLKPQNIMIDRDDTVCVADFGIAKSADTVGMTMTGQIIGTPEYMSPEQAEGKEVDFRSDLYSFGLVLYEMLTGQVPFKADSIISTLMLRLREAPQAPSKTNPAVPQWLDRLTMRCLERDVQARYGSAEEILKDIELQKVKARPKLKPRMLIVIAAVIIVGAASVFVILRQPKLVLAEKRIYLAVLPFENVTNEPELDWLVAGIPDNLTADLAQSKFFRVMSLERLRQVATEIGKEMAEMNTAEAIALLAKATDLDAVAVGSFVKAGEKIRITMKIEDPSDQELIGSRIVEDTESGLLDLIDQLTRETKQIFALTQEDIDQDLDRALSLQRTRSVRAASMFSRGQEDLHIGSYLEAAQAFEAAIEADSNFAMAYAKASEAYGKLGYDEKAERLSFLAVDKVVKLIGNVPALDRTFILANHADITYNADQAIESYREFIDAYPDDPEGYYKLGLTYQAISEWDLAAENLTKALENDPKFVSARFELGKVLIRKEDLETALVELEKALTFYRDIGNGEGEATVLNAIGVVHRRRNDFDQAITYFEASIELKETLGDQRGIAASLGNLGLVYEIMGKREEAVEVLERSLEIKREIGDKEGIAIGLNKIGLIYQSYGRYGDALSYFERSYEIREEMGAKHMMAACLSDMGTIYSITGDYAKSIEMDSLALALRREIGDERGEAQSLRNMAETLITKGNLADASARLREALAIHTSLGDQRHLARDRQALGNHCLARGRVDSALSYLEEALALQESLEETPAVAVTLGLMGEAYTATGDYKRALANFDRMAELAESLDEPELTADLLLGKARVFYEVGYGPGCDSVITEIRAYDDKAVSFETRCRLGLTSARRLYGRGKYAEALAAARELVEVAGDRYARCRVGGRLLMAKNLVSMGRIAEVGTTLGQVASDARRYGFRDLESEALCLLAGLASEGGGSQKPVEACTEALRLRADRGLTQYKCLLSCGGIKLAAGETSEAAAYFIQALAEAADIYETKCPQRLKSHYLERWHVASQIDRLAEIAEPTGQADEATAFRTRFGLN